MVPPNSRRELTRMDNVHSAHCTTGVIENPFLLRVHEGARHRLLQLLNDVFDHAAGVIAMVADCALRDLMQLLLVENIELLQTRIEVAVERGEKCQEGGQETEGAHGEAAAARFGGLLAG